jgi:hypothetical protein
VLHAVLYRTNLWFYRRIYLSVGITNVWKQNTQLWGQIAVFTTNVRFPSLLSVKFVFFSLYSSQKSSFDYFSFQRDNTEFSLSTTNKKNLEINGNSTAVLRCFLHWIVRFKRVGTINYNARCYDSLDRRLNSFFLSSIPSYWIQFWTIVEQTYMYKNCLTLPSMIILWKNRSFTFLSRFVAGNHKIRLNRSKV